MNNWKSVKNTLEKYKIQNLLSLTNYLSKDLQIYLDNLVDNNESEEDFTTSDNFKNSEIIPNDLTSLFKKPWGSLPIVHQIIKIKEYCKNKASNKNNYINMEKKLVDKIKKRKLNKTLINYDEEHGKIISISKITELLAN